MDRRQFNSFSLCAAGLVGALAYQHAHALSLADLTKFDASVSDAYNTYPLAVKLHIADLTATYLMEQGTSEVENGHPKSK